MKIEAIPYGALPCNLQVFNIKGIFCVQEWFIEMDSDPFPEECEGYDCHNKHAVPLDLEKVKSNIEGKIKLEDEEIKKVQEILMEVLNVGDCGWCV